MKIKTGLYAIAGAVGMLCLAAARREPMAFCTILGMGVGMLCLVAAGQEYDAGRKDTGILLYIVSAAMLLATVAEFFAKG